MTEEELKREYTSLLNAGFSHFEEHGKTYKIWLGGSMATYLKEEISWRQGLYPNIFKFIFHSLFTGKISESNRRTQKMLECLREITDSLKDE